MRGAMDEWLEKLSCGAESHCKARVQGWASPYDDWKTLSVNPAGERWAPPFISCAQDTVGL